MRILLRDRKTKQYFQTPGNWTDDSALALDFESSRQARQLAEERGLKDLEILLAFENAHHNIRLPMRIRR